MGSCVRGDIVYLGPSVQCGCQLVIKHNPVCLPEPLSLLSWATRGWVLRWDQLQPVHLHEMVLVWAARSWLVPVLDCVGAQGCSLHPHLPSAWLLAQCLAHGRGSESRSVPQLQPRLCWPSSSPEVRRASQVMEGSKEPRGLGLCGERQLAQEGHCELSNTVQPAPHGQQGRGGRRVPTAWQSPHFCAAALCSGM